MTDVDFKGLPNTEESLVKVLAALKKCKKSGDERGAAWAIVTLSQLVKHVRSDTRKPPFERSHQLAREALVIFRRVDDQKGIARALRAAAPFEPPPTRGRMLDEAVHISGKIRDAEGLGWGLMAQSNLLAPLDRAGAAAKRDEAMRLFESIGDAAGQAGCLFVRATRLGDGTQEELLKAAMEAAELYRSVGDYGGASRAMTLAALHAQGADFEVRKSILNEGLSDSQRAGCRLKEANYYGRLAPLWREVGDAEQAEKYQRWHDEIEASDGLTPRQRERERKLFAKTMSDLAKCAGNDEAAKMFGEEASRKPEPDGDPGPKK